MAAVTFAPLGSGYIRYSDQNFVYKCVTLFNAKQNNQAGGDGKGFCRFGKTSAF
jgi:hypothetical protein